MPVRVWEHFAWPGEQRIYRSRHHRENALVDPTKGSHESEEVRIPSKILSIGRPSGLAPIRVAGMR